MVLLKWCGKVIENTVCVCSVPGCSFTTPDLSVFKSHMESVHADVKPSKPMTPCYPCTVSGCSYVFTSVGVFRLGEA